MISRGPDVIPNPRVEEPEAAWTSPGLSSSMTRTTHAPNTFKINTPTRRSTDDPQAHHSVLSLDRHPARSHVRQINRTRPAPRPNIAGNWTIYAYNVDKPGSSLKTIQVTQNGNMISGIFHGPHQHGKFQGWINGNHIEFSTDTRDVLTFRGENTPEGMSGLYGVHGRHAPWRPERTNP